MNHFIRSKERRRIRIKYKNIFNQSLFTFAGSVGLTLTGLSLNSCTQNAEPGKPNIIIILADDMGHGNVEVLNSESRIPTPNLNRLAEEGIIFSDAHTSSAVCTPTRYGLLTGRYSWRTRLKSGVLGHYAGTLIEPERKTIADILKKEGYYTGMVGKWHLGIDWKLHDESEDKLRRTDPAYFNYENIDFTVPATKGINDYGFDYSFAIAGSAEMNPAAFIENNKVTSPPVYTVEQIKEKNGEWYGRDDNNIAEGYSMEKLVPTFSKKACEFVENAVSSHPGKPFFLYYPLTTPHNPIVPNYEFYGKSKAGAYGDFVFELDHHVGKLMDKLRELGIEQNTIVIFTSDNGAIDITKNAERWIRGDRYIYGHLSNAPYRGWKTQRYEGGHRVPFFIKWPEKIEPGQTCATTICLNDIFPTLADMLNVKLDNNTAEDGKSFWSVITGKSRPSSFHEAIVHHSYDGQFAIRRGSYKLIIDGPKTPDQFLDDSLPVSYSLYDLSNDIKETTDISENHPELVKELHDLLKKYIKDGRSS
jgi:arylsulfatase A-like enzyme